METINIKELKGVLLPIAEEVRSKLNQAALNTPAQAHFSAMQKILSTLFMFLNAAQQEDKVDMEKLRNSLAIQVVDIEDIEPRHRSSEIEDLIKATLEVLPSGQAALIDPQRIKYRHLSGKIGTMIKEKKIPSNVKVKKRGDKVYLIKG